MFASLEPEPSSACKYHLFRAQAELSSEIKNYFEPKPSQARILTLSTSQAKPAQLELFGSSQLKLKPAQYTLSCHFTLKYTNHKINYLAVENRILNNKQPISLYVSYVFKKKLLQDHFSSL